MEKARGGFQLWAQRVTRYMIYIYRFLSFYAILGLSQISTCVKSTNFTLIFKTDGSIDPMLNMENNCSRIIFYSFILLFLSIWCLFVCLFFLFVCLSVFFVCLSCLNTRRMRFYGINTIKTESVKRLKSDGGTLEFEKMYIL